MDGARRTDRSCIKDLGFEDLVWIPLVAFTL